MIKLDRIKIVTDKIYIEKINTEYSTMVIKNNVTREIRFKQSKPFNLYISSNQLESKVIMEFSAKILRNKYPELINKNTIRSCFEIINNIGYCNLDIDGILKNSQVISMDITIDLDGICLPENRVVKSCLKNINKYQVQKYNNCGYTITKMVKTKNRQIRLIIYDKHKELNKATNDEFLNTLEDKYRLLAYFHGKYRIEANVKTVLQIKQLCKIESNNLFDVLNSSANPLLTIFDSIFDIPSTTETAFKQDLPILQYTKLAELKDALLIKACNNDPATIDLVLNNCLSPNTNKGKYRAKLNKIINSQILPNKNISVMRDIRNKLIKA